MISFRQDKALQFGESRVDQVFLLFLVQVGITHCRRSGSGATGVTQLLAIEHVLVDVVLDEEPPTANRDPDPINGAIWGVWSLVYAITIFVLLRKFSVLETAIISWVYGFVMMWLVVGNMMVLKLVKLP